MTFINNILIQHLSTIAIVWSCFLLLWGGMLSGWTHIIKRVLVNRSSIRRSDVWNLRIIWGMGAVVVLTVSTLPDLSLVVNTFHSMLLLNYTYVLTKWSGVIIANIHATLTL